MDIPAGRLRQHFDGEKPGNAPLIGKELGGTSALSRVLVNSSSQHVSRLVFDPPDSILT